MRKIINMISLMTFTLLLSCSENTDSSFSKDAFLLYNTNIIDVETGQLLANRAIVIDSGSIKQIDTYNKVNSLIPKEQHHDLENRYVIPGLWDMHAHIDQLSDSFEHSQSMLSMYTLNGVTSIREMGGDFKKIKALKSVADNHALMPTIYTAGPILENKDFVEWVAEVDNDPEFKEQRVGISSPDEVAHKIDSIVKLGVDFIKIRTAASPEVFFEVSKQCKKHNIKFCGHVDSKVGLYEAVESGISSLEHLDIFQLTGMSDSKMDSVVNLMKDLGTSYCPTLVYFKKHRIYDKDEIKSFLNDSLYQNPLRKFVSNSLLEKSKIAIQRAEESSVPWKEMEANFLKFSEKVINNQVTVLAGTDGANALVLPGFSLHEELQLYNSELGMDPLKILQSATINPAKYFGLEDKLGVVKQGYIADLVIVDENPLMNIKNTESIYCVIKSGRFISKNEIHKNLESISKVNKNATL